MTAARDGARPPLRICVFCASGTRIDRKYLDLAAEVGAELARRGHSLVSGGGSISCMGAVARAARTGGATTVGVIPRALVELEIADTGADELVITDDMRARKGEMDRRSDAFLVLPGGLGTLEELFEIWTARMLGLHTKPIVLLDPFGLYEPLRELLVHLQRERFARAHVFDALGWTHDVREAFALLERPARPLVPSPAEMLETEP